MHGERSSIWGSRGLNHRGRLLLGVSALLFYTSWVWAGLRPSFHLAGVVLAVVLLAVLLFRGRREDLQALWRDPFTWLGGLFLAYLAVQAFNSGRASYFDVGAQTWALTPPPWPALPWAFEGDEAMQVLAWFFPAWVLALALRSPAFDTRATHALLRGQVVGAGLLSLFGIVQFATDTKAIYWVTELRGAFFATFPYANHAAAYFLLMASLAAGLFLREVFERERAARLDRHVLLAVAMLLCLTGANLSLSRAGIVLSWLLAAGVLACGLAKGWRLLPPAGRLQLAAAMVGVVSLLFFLVDGLAARAIRREFLSKHAHGTEACAVSLQNVDLSFGDRPLLVHAAWDMWGDHRWFGVGGWGFGQLVGHYVPEDRWNQLRYEGKANVHCDPLQFLVEFGLVGGGLLAATLGVLVLNALPRLRHRGTTAGFSAAGLLLVGGLSCIDLPFRCPAILYQTITLLTVLPKIAHRIRPTNAMPGKSIS